MARAPNDATTMSASGAADTARAPVGEVLRSAREQLGWNLPEVAAWLRIRLVYLEALESGQVARLPGSAYAIGFLRAYASALGLDAEELARRFRSETKEVARRPELSFPVPVPERGVPAGAVVLLGVVVVVCAYVGWYEFTGHLTRETHVVPAVPAPLLPLAGGTPAASPQVATVMPGPGHAPSPLPPVPATTPAPTDTTSNDAQKLPAPSPETAGVVAQGAVVPPVSPPQALPSATPDAASVPPAAGTALPAAGTAAPVVASATPPAAADGQIVVNAVAASWVQVRAGGKVVYDHVLQPGESWTAPAGSADLTLSVGNAGGVTVSADGVTSAVLGRIGGVRRNVVLSAASIKDGSVASAASAAAPAPHRPAARSSDPAAPPKPVEDETDRLNRAQLKTPPQD